MKTIKIAVLISVLFIIFACELDNATPIRIALVTPPPGVVKLHLAVFSGDEVLTQTSVDVSDLAKDNMIELYVSPGKNRQIVMVAESFNANRGVGFASYLGQKVTDIFAGKEVSVGLQMHALTYTLWTGTGIKPKFWATYDYSRTPSPNYTVEWASTEIPAVKYRVEEDSLTGFQLFYEGYATGLNRLEVTDGNSAFRIKLMFEFCNLETEFSSF
ncbi:MAG: hypothetical protein JW982_08105 [Spirochaetes bacterium]|nr:hypothetical protein [Spirochaetota bacterium]